MTDAKHQNSACFINQELEFFSVDCKDNILYPKRYSDSSDIYFTILFSNTLKN